MTKQRIDWDTGELYLAGRRLIIGPGSSYKHFRRLSFRWRFKISQIRLASGTVIRYATFRWPITLGDVSFKLLLIFDDNRLDTVDLSALRYPDGRKWKKHTDPEETTRSRIHGEWLERQLGPAPPSQYCERSFPWGSVMHTNDPREETEANVQIKYRK